MSTLHNPVLLTADKYVNFLESVQHYSLSDVIKIRSKHTTVHYRWRQLNMLDNAQ